MTDPRFSSGADFSRQLDRRMAGLVKAADWRSCVPRSVTDDLTPGGDEVHTPTDRRMLWHIEMELSRAPSESPLRNLGRTLRAYLHETCQHHWQRYPAYGDLAAHRQCLWCTEVEWEAPRPPATQDALPLDAPPQGQQP